MTECNNTGLQLSGQTFKLQEVSIRLLRAGESKHGDQRGGKGKGGGKGRGGGGLVTLTAAYDRLDSWDNDDDDDGVIAHLVSK